MAKVKGVLQVGDTVSWRGGFGTDAPKDAVIEAIDINCKGGKDGKDVKKVKWDKVTRANVVVSLDNGHWAYGDQLKEK